MSILDLAIDLQLPRYEDLPVPAQAESAHADNSYVERAVLPALKVSDKGMQDVLKLEKLINDRGRNSDNAKACRGVIQDYFLGLDDLRRTLTEVKEGKVGATEKIPGIMAALQESFNPEALLSKMTAYTNKNTKEKALPNYVYEMVSTLGGLFENLSVEMQGISDVLDVQLQVRRSVTSALEKYKFHGVQKAAVVAEADPFDKEETAWFENEVVPTSAPTQARKGFMSRITAVLGDLADSVKRTAPRAALAGLMLSLGGCNGCGEDAPVSSVPPIPVIPTIPVIVPAPVPQADWKISDTRDITHAIRSALAEKCPGLTKAQLIKAEGPLVHDALVAQTSGLTQVVQAQQIVDTDGEWLGKVSADEVQYGNSIPSSYPEVLANTASARITGAHGLDSDTVKAYARSGLPAYSTYTCPSK